MHEGLIERHNAVVGPDDISILLGDVAFNCVAKMDNIKSIIQRLNGKIKGLVRGNHDKLKHVQQMGFDFIADDAYLEYNGLVFWLNHFPFESHDERDLARPKPLKPWNVACYGHCHSTSKQIAMRGGKLHVHVGCDAWEHPVSLKELAAIYRNGQ
jgi:calcineurin-like phosphoesterase family protein